MTHNFMLVHVRTSSHRDTVHYMPLLGLEAQFCFATVTRSAATIESRSTEFRSMPTRKSLAFSFLDRYATLVIGIVSSMVIARLLTPEEIGIYSVAMVLLGFLATVRDLGVGQYLVQEKELTTDRIRAVWAVQLGLGLALSVVILLASVPVAAFYREPQIREIMLLIALSYAVNPFGSLTYAWLMREMRFSTIALMRFLSSLAGASVGIWFAWRDFGPISLAYGSLTSTVVNALVALWYRPKSFPWAPGIAEIRRVLSVGSQLTLNSVVGVIATSAPELLLGRLQSLTAAGFYSRASGLVQMFNRLFVDAVTVVCLPWFAKESRAGGSLVTPFLRATSYVTALGWSFCVGIVCLAHPVIRLLYGDQWDMSVDLARMLAASIAFGVPVTLCPAAMMASGGVASMTRVTLVCAVQSIALVAIGASHSLTGVGVAMVVSTAVAGVIWTRTTSRHLGVPASLLFLTLRKSGLVALFAATGPVFTLWLYGPYPNETVLPIAFGAVGGLAGFALGVVITGHPLKDELIGVWARIRPA